MVGLDLGFDSNSLDLGLDSTPFFLSLPNVILNSSTTVITNNIFTAAVSTVSGIFKCRINEHYFEINWAELRKNDMTDRRTDSLIGTSKKGVIAILKEEQLSVTLSFFR